jgi:hypothetical protein
LEQATQRDCISSSAYFSPAKVVGGQERGWMKEADQ